MKYTKLFNNHSEYVAYTGGTAFIRPNVSWCILEEEPHCTPALEPCEEQHIYEIMGEPSYTSTVPASATSFDLSFTYSDTYTARTCEQGSFIDGDTVTIPIEENPSISARTISGAYVFHDISIPYTLTQEGQPSHDYSKDYLTFDVLSGGTIYWVASNGVEKTISYSINNGAWTSITSATVGTPINVSVGDKVRLKGTNSQYGVKDKKDYAACFSGGTAYYNIEGNIMSLIGGDNFSGLTSFTTDWVFHDLFNTSKAVSAENLVLPVTELTTCCYRAMFAHSASLVTPPELPATTLAHACYWYMFQDCPFTTAPDLNATTLVKECYGGMFDRCSNVNYIKCLATNISASDCLKSWVNGVASTGTFVKDPNINVGSGGWTRNSVNGIPNGWLVIDEGTPDIPTISCNGLKIELSCGTEGADIYYKLTSVGSYSAYTSPIIMTGDTDVWCYSEKDGVSSTTTSMTCEYDDRTIYEYANQSLDTWTRSGSAVTVPNSVNAIDGHSSSYAKGTFDYETTVNLRDAEPTYLWFQHADHKADIYVDDVLVDTHWGGYNAFFSDISNYAHEGTNHIKVTLKNNNGDYLAPASGDFNFNATLGKVKLFTSPYMPAMNYGYDGFHITSTVSTGSATINVATSIPTGATVVCTISGVNCNYTATSASTGNEMIFTTTISNPRLWNGTIDPYLYNVKLEVYYNNELYHRYERPYGLRFYEYVINQTVGGSPYTGFLLNGQPYLLRGCCMHDDIAGKANALNAADYTQQFNLITDLGLNFLRLAHYPHPKEVYDWCDRLGIIVESEVPCVNNLQTTMPEAYWTHLVGQYNDMVNQHYNHPCIMFWGLSNEAKVTDSSEGRTFAKEKIEGYVTQIKKLDNERLVGLVAHALTDPISYFGGPTNIDWIGSNLYEGWYQNTSSNNPTSRLNTCISNTVSSSGVAFAFSEYGCGGTQRCHSESASTTTNKGSNGARHDIEYQMWLHEGHIAAIKNKPQLLFSAQWVLFDFAVSNRNEGYTVCLDGENTSIDESLRRLNDKGLVERDHVTKKDTFYLYKAWWNTADTFVHICGKNYEKIDDRVIKCYTNVTGTLTMYINGTSAATASVTNNIAEFAARDFVSGDVVSVSGSNTGDSFTISGITKKHDYVEIAGTKWSTSSIGAANPTDEGLYFQWGDVSGYTASQIGGIYEGKKPFSWADYKYGNGTGSPGETGMTKYNSTDGKIILDASDDAAVANYGSDWKTPTMAEWGMLADAVNTAWTASYQGSGVSGLVCTDKTDNTKILFFPVTRTASNGKVLNSTSVSYWSSILSDSKTSAKTIFGSNTGMNTSITSSRCSGKQIRPVKDYDYVDLGLPSGTKWATMNVGATSETDYGKYYQYGKGADTYQVTSGQSNYSGTENPLALSADTAAQVWGGQWHMPTRAQVGELVTETTYTWETNFNNSGINGAKFTNKTDSTKYIFIPAAGYFVNGNLNYVNTQARCWGSVPNGINYAYMLYANSTQKWSDCYERKEGYPVRPVKDA